MSTPPQTPPPFGGGYSPTAQQGLGQPTPYPAGPPFAPPPSRGTSGVAIAGLILAILAAPIGFILSIIGLFTTGKNGKKGKGLAVTGLIISILIMAGSGVLIATAGKNISTVADPGCIKGKAAILNVPSDAADPNTFKTQLQTIIDQLNAAATAAKHDNVRNAMKAMADDYTQLLQAMDSGNIPDGLESKVDTDANTIDSLCTIGGAK